MKRVLTRLVGEYQGAAKRTAWKTSTLGDLCDMYQPQTIGTKDLVANGPYPVFGANGIIGRYDRFNHEEPQLLITCRGATCGSVNISEPKSWITGNAMVVRPKNDSIDLKFLEYIFRGGINISKAITGAAQPQITRANLVPLKITFPTNVEEQQRIVNLLDAADELRKLRAQTDQLTAELIPALFHEMFGDASHPRNGCVVLPVGEMIKNGSLLSIQDGNHGEVHPKAAEYLTEGIPFIFANHIAKNELDLSSCPFLSVERARKLRVGFARPNDVLLSHKGSIGFTAVVPRELEFAVLSPQVTYYRFDTTKIDPFYAWAYFQTASFQATFERLSRQATRAYVGITRQKELPFLVAPLPLQKEFAERVSEIRELKASQSTSRAHLEKLFQSMLQRAFAGEI